ncbi:TonB family protein [Daejeonella sp.]|uniref:TonB family protein n=1 Tax=Daejeonella sp. TaxID=2805397 RepID=UPI0030C16988
MYLNLILGFLVSLSLLFAPSKRLVSVAYEQPAFKGGQKSLISFIDNHLIYPAFSKDNCLQGTIQVSFKLNKQGKIFDSKVQKGFGVDLDVEALRIIRLTSGKWIMPVNHDTTISLVLPVNFTLRDFKCEQRSRDEINSAINAYHARLGLNNAIYNFYDKKAEGSYNQVEEARVIALKAQLGYDNKFIDRLLKQAQRKLKQGDKEGACEDAQTIRRLGSVISAALIEQNCK